MNQKIVKAWRIFDKLPPEAQRQVFDFIAFLQTRYTPSRSRKVAQPTNLATEPFIGMWRSRKDLQDSSTWVRRLREREWMSRRE